MGVFGIGGRGKGKDDGEKGKLAVDPAQAVKLLPLLVALLGLLGIWCLASGALRIRDDARHAGLQVARDDAVMSARRTLRARQRYDISAAFDLQLLEDVVDVVLDRGHFDA